MPKDAFLVIDQGTTGTAVSVITPSGQFITQSDHEFPQYFPQPGWVEHDAEEIYHSVLDGISEVLTVIGSRYRLAAIGITNQRETIVIWDRQSGRPIAPAIVWQDRRTAEYCAQLHQEGLEPFIRNETGLLLDPYFSATKLRWLLDHIPNARARAERGELAAGTIDTWLIWKLSGGRSHITDRTNASRTLLYSLVSESWHQDLCRLFNIPLQILPHVTPSSGEAAITDPRSTAGLSIPITGIAGDQQAALVGQACFAAGEAKNTYGTGCFLLVHVGKERRLPVSRLLLTSAIGEDTTGQPATGYAIEGSVFIAGAAIQWLRDELQILSSAAQSEQLAISVPDTGGVIVVPAFTGLGAPYWDPYARGAILGLTRGASRAHIIRATLEAIALQTADLVKAMSAEGIQFKTLRVDGGGTANNFLMQLQADFLGFPVERARTQETTSLGAALLAGLGCGLITNIHTCRQLWQLDRTFVPHMPASEREQHYARWQKAVSRVTHWED